jgi:hypothetical protein
VRKLRRAHDLAAEGKTGEEIAAKLGVSAATLYNWRRTYGGMDTDAAKELKSCANVVTPVAPRSSVRDNGVVGAAVIGVQSLGQVDGKCRGSAHVASAPQCMSITYRIDFELE